MSNDEEWDDSLDDVVKSGGITPQVARAMLAMNPQLRASGVNTVSLVEQSQEAAARRAGPVKAVAKQNEGLPELVKSLEASTRLRDHQITLEIAALEVERQKLRADAVTRIGKWLAAHDPNILSPMTQNVLKDTAAFLSLIGFKIADYAARFRNK